MATVLLVDDDRDLVEAYRMVLTASGHQVVSAHSAQEARLTVAGSGPPDIAVIDVMMETPTVGFELARELRQRFPDLPIIVLSAVREATGVPFSFEPDDDYLPVTRFIDKPADPATMVKEIEAVLAES